MTISANQLRPGTVVEYEGKLWQCLQSIHKTPGNLRAFVQAKMRSVRDGTQKEFRFASTEMLQRVDLRQRPMQFLYSEGDLYFFMDQENYEQTQLGKDMLGDAVGYLLPEAIVQVTFYEETPIGVELPKTIDFLVIEAEPNMKSATATSSYKNAKIETGVNVQVPQFIEVGNKITINTETGEYMSRAKDNK